MNFTDLLIFALLALAVAAGYWLGRSGRLRGLPSSSPLSWPQQRYYEGLTQLLNDQPDAAIDTFISALDVNNDTLETHLALASLLRRRGEVARAIRVHQNLLARPSLSRAQHQLAQLELGIDYLRSGLLDRAESLFKELVEVYDLEKNVRKKALEHLLEVYQDTKEWLAAIDVADRLTTRKFSPTADSWRELQAQYSCELAQEAIEKQDWLAARRCLNSALRYDKKCVRANLLVARLEMIHGSYPSAIVALRRVPQQNEKFSPEILGPIYECYKKQDSPRELLNELRELYYSKKDLLTLQYLTKTVEVCEGGDAAIALLMEELRYYPKMEVAAELLKLVTDERGPNSLRNYVKVKALLEKLTETRQVYQCENCGFSGEQLHWLCPSCKHWVTISLQPHLSNIAPNPEKLESLG